MSARFCGECGVDATPNSQFCTACGAPSVAGPGTPPVAHVTQAAFLPPPPPPPPMAPMAAPASEVTIPAWAVAPPPPPPAPAMAPMQRPGSPRRRTGLLVGVGILALAIISGGLTVWLLNRGGSDGPTADRSGALNVRSASIDHGISVLAEPDRVWEFSATSLAPGASLGPMSPTSYSRIDDVLHFPGVFVTQVVDEDRPARLVGVDPANGTVIWEYPLGDYGSDCFLPDPQYLYCITADGDLALLDPSDGTVESSHAVEGWISLVLRNKVLYVLHAGGTGTGRHPMTLAAFDADTLDPLWNEALDDKLGIGDGATNDFDGGPYLEFDNGSLVASYGPLEWRVDPASHQVLSHAPVDWDTSYAEEDGHTVDTGENTTTVRDSSGRLVLQAPGNAWSSEGYIKDGAIGIGSSVYDLATARARWNRADLVSYDDYGDPRDWGWAFDRRNVITRDGGYDTDNGPSGDLLDAATGNTLLHLASVVQPLMRTDDAIITISNGQVSAHDATTGALAWTRALPGDFTTLTASGDSLIATGSSGFAVLTDFPSAKPSGGDSDGDTAYVTACGAPPEFIPTASTTKFSGVAITYEVKATCDGGQWLNHSQLSVPFVVDGYAYASGYFDFSTEPFWIPEDGQDLELVYPFENTQVPEPRFDQAIQEDGGTGKVVQVPCEPGPDNSEGAVPSDPSYGADPGAPTTADGAPDESNDDDRDETALEALQRIADEDASAVGALGTNWTAQLSSKKPGTADDGKIYDAYDDILALHLQHRARYPDSLLVYSNDWVGSFGPSSQDYWVTLSGQSEATSGPILRWCTDEGWGQGDCWAKRLQHSGDPDLNTDKNEPDDRNN